MRRILPLFVSLALVAACGGGGDSGDSGGGGGGGGDGDGAVDASRCPVDVLEAVTAPVKITFWHGMTAANEETLKQLTEAYNGSQDRVRVELAFQGDYNETSDKYLTALRGGDLPDLVQLEETRVQLMIDSESVVPAQACVESASYDLGDHLQPVLDQATVDGVLWPMPFNISSPVLFFNAAKFTEAGLDPDDPPTTFEELRAASQQIVDRGVAPHGVALPLAADHIEQWFAKADQPFVNNENGRADRATEAVFDDETGRMIYEFLQGMVDDGLALNTGPSAAGPNNLIAVGSGDAVMTINSSAALGSILDVLAQGAFPGVTPGVGPMPGPTEGGVLVGGASLYIVDKGKSDEQKAAAWDFARYLNEPQQQADWHAGTGYLPIRMSSVELPTITELWAEQPYFQVAYDQLLDSEAGLGGPVIGGYSQVREAVTASLEDMYLQDVPAAEALATAAEQATAEIQDYNDRVGA